MDFLYFYRVSLPETRADAIQIVNTCLAIARAGGRVRLHVEDLRSPSMAACLDYYGLNPPAPDGAGDLRLVCLGRHWSWPSLDWKTRGLFSKSSGKDACLFVREVRPYVPGLIARARSSGLPVIFEAHNVSTSLVEEKSQRPTAAQRLRRKASRRAALEESILRTVDALVCTQEATVEGLRPLLPPGLPVMVLGNATQTPPTVPSRNKDIDILYCGSLKPWKGVDTLVAAMSRLHQHKLTIVGPMVARDVTRLRGVARRAGVEQRIAIEPSVRPSDVWSLYARAQVGVIPLPGKGFVEARRFTSPLKLFEMMASGLPVVASRLQSICQYVRDGQEAVLVEPDDPEALAAGIRRILEETGLAARLAAAACQRARDFTWDARGRKLLEFAEKLRR